MGQDFYSDATTVFSGLLHDPRALSIFKALGKNWEDVMNIVNNMNSLNYYGMYFSEVISNQIKSDYIFIKLCEDGTKLTFKPSTSRIN